MEESMPNDGGRLPLKNSRLMDARRISDSSWRKVSLMSTWRDSKNKRRARSLDSAVPSKSATDNGGAIYEPTTRKQSNGVSQCQQFSTIAEASVEDDPSSALSADKAFLPTVLIESAVAEELTEDSFPNVITDEHVRGNNLEVTETNDCLTDEFSPNDNQEEVTIREHVTNGDDTDDAFYDSDVEQEDNAQTKSVTPGNTRRLQSRSCIFHNKPSPQTRLKKSPNADKDEMKSTQRRRSWSESVRKSSSNPSKSPSTRGKRGKKMLPSPFLWQPSVDYLDVPRHLLRQNIVRSDGNIADSAEKDEPLPMTKRLTSSFRMLFRKSQEKNIESDKRSKASSESVV